MSLPKNKSYWTRKYELEFKREMLLTEVKYEQNKERKDTLTKIITSIDTVLITLEEEPTMRLRA